LLVTHSGPRWIGPPSSNDFVDIYAQGESEMCDTDLIALLLLEDMDLESHNFDMGKKHDI
jgi:hypothetical protein